MRAARLDGTTRELQVTQVEAPSPGPGEVIVNVTACGVCGSDVHIATIGPAGTILGHEIAGTVAAAGADVDATRWPPGTAVAIRPLTGCGACAWCRRGRQDHCDTFALVGLNRPGGFAEQVAVPADTLHALPATVTGVEQALVEPLAVARHALRRVGLQPGEDVLVLGGGPIGLAVTAWARTLGARTVVVSDPVASRRRLAMTLGATVTADPAADDVDAVARDACGAPPPVVVECSGAPGALADSLSRVGVDGRIGVVGICLAPEPIVPFLALQKELDIRFALYYGPGDFVDTIDALDQGTLVAGNMITETLALDALPARFAQLTARPDGGKVVVVP